MTNGSKVAVCAVSLLMSFLGLATIPVAAFGYTHINSFSAHPSVTQAGGHPDVEISQTWDNRITNLGGAPESANSECECQDAFEVKNDFPTGFIGNAAAIAKCTLLALSLRSCPVESQIGVAELVFPGEVPNQAPILNMEPHPGEPGLFAFYAPVAEFPVLFELAARTDSDYGLTARATGIYHPVFLDGIKLYLWGVPGDPIHDIHRFPSPQTSFCVTHYPVPCTPPTAFEGTIDPFLEAPTSCGVNLSMGLDVTYYDFTQLHADTAWPATTGCDQLSFNPSLTAKPTTRQAESAAGVDVDMLVPQTQSGGTPSPSEIKSTKITFPAGVAINPNAADGKSVCGDVESAIGTLKEARCPEHSKVGTLSIDSRALPAPIDGAIYLGAPKPGDRYRLILAADGFSTHVKLAGIVHTNPENGQLVVSFPNLPQSPLEEFNLHLFGSERGLLVTPSDCGRYEVETEFVPWDEALPNQTSIAYFAIDSGPNGEPCPGQSRPFGPQVEAGSRDSSAGARSPFGLSVLRADGEQDLSGLSVTTPSGFAASLKGVSYCPDSVIAKLSVSGYSGQAEQGLASCPPSSLVGTAVVGAGAGTHPVYVPGKVYLAGPYRGAPLSLEVVVPAVSGPYDLGVVAVRAPVHIDPLSAQVTTVSDPLPQILEGIPLRLRSIQVNLDRPEFTINPTNCNPSSINTTLLGSQGAVSRHENPFQVANCALLPFSPRLSLKLSGGLNRRGHPAISSTFTALPGESNTHLVSVALPKGELLDNAHISGLCTRVQFAAQQCPQSSVLGHAEATSPLLDKPLSGNVYLRSSSEVLPNLVADLRGQLNIELVGRIDTVHGGSLRTSFEHVPDVPVSSFTLKLAGGAKGLLQNSTSLCGKVERANVKMVGQSSVAVATKTRIQLACGSKARHKRHVHQRRVSARGVR